MECSVETKYRHYFAAWCAATAARAAPECKFKVKEGREIIEAVGLSCLSAGWGKLPASSDFDKWHEELRCKICGSCEVEKINKRKIKEKKDEIRFTHGVAAKLINVYLKALFLASSQDCLSEENRAKRDAIHPPVDSVLLEKLQSEIEAGKISAEDRDVECLKRGTTPWSNLNSCEYEEIICAFRHIVGDKGLWAIEKYWPGHQ